jgi:hypothetical protein
MDYVLVTVTSRCAYALDNYSYKTSQWYQTTQISITKKKRGKENLTILCINCNQIIPSEDLCTHGFHSPPLYELFHIVDIWNEFKWFGH